MFKGLDLDYPELFINYADTNIYLFSYVPVTMDLLKQDIKHISYTFFPFYVGILYPSSEPILPRLFRCSPFAVAIYSFMGRFLHLIVRVRWVGLDS
jgi:hypothetical protein